MMFYEYTCLRGETRPFSFYFRCSCYPESWADNAYQNCLCL